MTPQAHHDRHRLRRYHPVGLLLGVMLILLLAASTVVWSTPAPAAALPGAGITLEARAQSDHFVVRALHDRVAQQTLKKAERAWKELSPHFTELPRDPVAIVVVEDSAEYKRIQPAPMTRGFATFGGRLIYLLGDQLDQEVVTHELVHILMGYNVAPDLRLPDWFNEGLAQYASGARGSSLSLLGWSGSIEILPLSTLDTVDALKGPHRELATIEGLAVVQFLVARYGEPALWDLTARLGHADSFEQALLDTYGRTDLQLNEQWLAYADSTYGLLSPAGLRTLGTLGLGSLVLLAAAAWLVRRTVLFARSDPGSSLTEDEIEAADLFQRQDDACHREPVESEVESDCD